jgi:hypothetical protein
LFAAAAVFASSIAQPWIDDDEIICSVDDSDSVRTEDPGRSYMNSRQSADDEEIQPVESRGEHADSKLARTWHR